MRLRRTLLGRLFIEAGWSPVLVFLFHLILSFFHVYEAWAPTDIVLHIVGGISIALCFHNALTIFKERYDAIDFTMPVHYLLTFSLTGSATVFWEFGEFLADRILNTQVQRGLEDTLLDMALGIVGGSITLSVIYFLKCHNAATIETRNNK